MYEFIKNYKPILVILIITTVYVLLYDFCYKLYLSSDFLTGVWVEFHGVLIEVALVVLGLGFWNSHQENKRWRPARTAIALKVLILHKELTYSLKWIVASKCSDSCVIMYHPNLNLGHYEFDIACRKKHLENSQEKLLDLEKAVQFSSSSLGSETLLMAIDYMEKTRELHYKMEWLIDVREKLHSKEVFKGEMPISLESIKNMIGVTSDIMRTYEVDFDIATLTSLEDLKSTIEKANLDKIDLIVNIEEN